MPSYLIAFCSTARPLKRTSCQVPVPLFSEPGACSSSCDICRPFTGRLFTSRWVTLTPMRAELMSMTLASAVTLTVSDTPAGCSSKSSASSWPAFTVIPGYSSGAKLGVSTLIV